MNILWFELADARYGLPLSEVREVVRAVAIAPLPGAPPLVEGVIDLRGQVIPAIDIRTRFGITSKPVDLTDVLIITSHDNDAVALRVDRAGWPIEVPEADIAAGATVLTTSPFVAGVARTPDGLVVIYDVASFLSVAERTELTAALERRNSGSHEGA